jgi:hypothetical protein
MYRIIRFSPSLFSFCARSLPLYLLFFVLVKDKNKNKIKKQMLVIHAPFNVS